MTRLAKEMGMTPQMYSRLIKERTDPRTKYLATLAINQPDIDTRLALTGMHTPTNTSPTQLKEAEKAIDQCISNNVKLTLQLTALRDLISKL